MQEVFERRDIDVTCINKILSMNLENERMQDPFSKNYTSASFLREIKK